MLSKKAQLYDPTGEIIELFPQSRKDDLSSHVIGRRYGDMGLEPFFEYKTVWLS